MFNAVLIIFFLTSAVYAQDAICNDAVNVQNGYSACVSSDPRISDILQNVTLNPAAAIDVVCKNHQTVVDFLECMTNNAKKCLPKTEDYLNDFIPSKENWKNGLEFVCSHKAELIGALSCLMTFQEDLKNCAVNSLPVILNSTNMTSREDKLRIVCRALNFKPCIQAKGSCNETTLSILSQLFEKIIPLNQCQASESSQQGAPSAASSMSLFIMGFYGLGLIAMWLFKPLF